MDEDVEDARSSFQKKAKAMRAIRMAENLRAPLSTKPPAKRRSAKQMKLKAAAAATGDHDDDFVNSEDETEPMPKKRMRLSVKVGDQVIEQDKAALMPLHGKPADSEEEASLDEEDDFDPYSTVHV